MTIDKSDFLKFIGTPFEHYILPIIPAGATLAPESSLTADHLGKIPGKFAHGPRYWFGFMGWQSYWTTKFDLEKWQGWQDPDKADTAIAVALRLRTVIAIDIDIDDPVLADEAELRVVMVLGKPLAVRLRVGNARRVLIYGHKTKTMPITKSRVVFTIEGGGLNAIEVLGEGQEVVIEGPHAKGAMHYWRDGKGLANLTVEDAEASRAAAPEDILSLHQALFTWIKGNEGEGWKHIVSGGGGKARTEPLDTHEISSPASPLWIKNEERGLLARAMQAINLDDPRIDYDRFVALNRALCASTGCDIGFLHEVVWPWVCTQTIARGSGPRTEDRGVEWLEDKWRTFGRSSFGADYIYRTAAAFGFTEGLPREEIGDDTIAALYGAPAEEGAAETAAERGDAGAGGGGSLAPRDTDANVRDSFIAKHGWRFRYIVEIRDPRIAWVEQKGGIWVEAYNELARAVSDHCCEIGAAYRNSGPGGPAREQRLNSANMHNNIERMLAKSPGIAISIEDFDRDPWQLNTSDVVIDIRTLDMRPHTADDLMRMRTAISPALAAQGFYNVCCPRWMEYIDFMSNGDDRVKALLRRYGAYCLTGYANDLFFLFMQGVPNGGKSVFQDVLMRMLSKYLKPVSQYFFIAQQGKRTFELSQLKGKRGAFAGEVPKGSRWDVQLISTMLGGSELSAEGKGTSFKDFYNTAKILVAGNHRPSFPSTTDPDGIDRRMLLLEFPRSIEGVLPDDKNFAQNVVAAEGPAILMWFLEEAQAGWESLQRDGSFMGNTIEVGLELARIYRERANPHMQWVEEEMQREGQIPGKQAWHTYLEYGDRMGLWKSQKKEGYDDFLTAMRTLGFRIGAPTSHIKGRAKIILGLSARDYSAAEAKEE